MGYLYFWIKLELLVKRFGYQRNCGKEGGLSQNCNMWVTDEGFKSFKMKANNHHPWVFPNIDCANVKHKDIHRNKNREVN